MIYVNVNWIGLDWMIPKPISCHSVWGQTYVRGDQLDLLPEKQSHPLSCFSGPIPPDLSSLLSRSSSIFFLHSCFSFLNIMRLVNLLRKCGKAFLFECINGSIWNELKVLEIEIAKRMMCVCGCDSAVCLLSFSRLRTHKALLDLDTTGDLLLLPSFQASVDISFL